MFIEMNFLLKLFSCAVIFMHIYHENKRLVEGKRSRENIFWKQLQKVFGIYYTIIYVWNLQMQTYYDPLQHVQSWEDFWQFLRIAFLRFSNFSRSSEACSGMPQHVHTQKLLKNKQTPVKLCISNSFLREEKTIFRR